jgi:hypothetical protein
MNIINRLAKNHKPILDLDGDAFSPGTNEIHRRKRMNGSGKGKMGGWTELKRERWSRNMKG